MARLKSLDLKLVFDTSYKTHPVTIKYKGKSVNDIDLSITRTDQKEEIQFEGFTPHDTTQKVTCTLTYNNSQVDIYGVTSFQMANNPYVKNTVIDSYTEVGFNGTLNLEFYKQWFSYNILLGANLDEDYVHWDQMSFTNQEVFCVGDSLTFGHGVAMNETWPSLLNRNAFNFGSKGLSHDGCLKNVKHILENSSSVKQIICLMPTETRKLLNFEFLEVNGNIPINFQEKRHLPKEYHQDVADLKEFIVNGPIEKDWIKSCIDIIDLCGSKNVECWLSTYDPDMYPHIPNKYRLPIFPKLDTFRERASDNQHPHRKHYELFVKSIKPYVDKKQS
jgi:hypothetical protein